MTDKSDDNVGHLDTILAQGGGNLNDPIFKSSNARGLPGGGGGGMLKFRVDRRIMTCHFPAFLPRKFTKTFEFSFSVEALFS